MLKITPASGAPIVFETLPSRTFRGQSGVQAIQGYDQQRRIPFLIRRAARARLPLLEAIAGKNVSQTVNRSGRIQLRSDKACGMVRFDWDAPKHRVNVGWNELYSVSFAVGVFEVTQASVQGMSETLQLTLFVGDWLWQGGEVVVYE